MCTPERDPRVMNRMAPDIREVHMLLEKWARYVRDPGVAGYPRQSITEKAALYGRLGIPQEPLHKPEPAMPDDVAAVDAAVSRLGQIDRRVIMEYYTQWAPIEVMAHHCGMRVPQFRHVLRRARWRISGYVSAWKDGRH